ncbi:synaptotagmin-15-like isoform X2 [Clavelina lepadiformis]|uniref:synaptotagmin-15-like isoform X2 n=1 Tax=Clavelina lepadiformis TaxID=159417 RepID=UPI004043534A
MFKSAFRQIWQNGASDVIEYGEKSDNEIGTHTGHIPITRIHPVANNGQPSTPPSAPRSPAIGRAFQGDVIPFVVPPLSKMRISQSYQLQPVQPTFKRDRVSIESRGTLNQSDDGSSVGSENSLSGTPVLPRVSQASSLTGFSVDSTFSECNSLAAFQSRNTPLGRFDPKLYICSEAVDTDLHQSRCGRVWFSMVYDGAVESLTVKVLKVKQLPPREHNNSPRDSIVKLFLLPDERISQQTKVRMRNNNPTFNETFVFQVSSSEIRKRTLRLSVFDTDKKKSTRSLLGHALISLNDIDPSKVNEVVWRDLDDIAHPGDIGGSLGELHNAITYFPNLDRLGVVVLEAKNLCKLDLEATGVYVKVSLKQGHQVIKTKKTTTKDGLSDPQFNESFAFKVSAKDIDQTCLFFNVVTTGGKGAIYKMTSTLRNTVTKGHFGASEHKYGRVAIGSYMYCRGGQLLHWQEIMAQPRKSVARWHTLSEIIVNE